MKKKEVTASEVEKGTEVYQFNYKGIKVAVKINYKHNTISLLENIYDDKNYKKYIFADRGVEYMASWVVILEAMQEAIKDAKKRYEAELAERSKFKEDNLVAVVRIMQENPIGKKGGNKDSKGRFVLDNKGRKVYL